MGCFSVQKIKRKPGSEQAVKADQPEPAAGEEGDTPPPSGQVLSAPPSFKSRVRAIQNAQRFINSNPRLRSSHPSYGSRESVGEASPRAPQPAPPPPPQPSSSSAPGPALSFASASSPSTSSSTTAPSITVAGSLSPPVPLGGRALSSTELGSSLFDIAASYSTKAAISNIKPMPLPSPQPSPKRSGYPLPRPSEHALAPSPDLSSAISSGIALCKGKVFPSDLQPLPPTVKYFSYEDLATSCHNFSQDSHVEHDGGNMVVGSIKTSNGKGEKYQGIVVLRLWEKWQQTVKEWILDLSGVPRLHNPHLCKLLGYYADERSTERMLVYEKLQRGSLHNLLFKSSDSPPLDWASRMKIALGAAQGLASLHEKCSNRVMYRDFRISHIQVDTDYSSKISGYWFFSNTIISDIERTNRSSNPRANAYCAPETVSRGEVSLKSNVWSYGVALLELLSGRQNMDERAVKEGKETLVKWARPFLMDEGRLFLIMDPKLQGRFPAKGSKLVADLVLQCLQKDQTKRPEMSRVLDVVKSVHEVRYTSKFTSREAGASTGAGNVPFTSVMSAKTSIFHEQERPPHLWRSPLVKFELVDSPPLRPLVIPPRSCATSYTMEEAGHQHEYYSSAPLEHLRGF